ncbi:MAG: response regulator [Anaerolineales bacterium]|jgi:two-component system response regulator NreC
MEEIRLMLVDDHEVIRVGLKSFLQTQEGIKVVAEASNGEEALELALRYEPDIILMDITMPGMDGLEATRRLHVLSPNCKVLALTVHDDKQYFMQMLAAGASGYITKQAAADDLMGAIKTVAQGHLFLQPALARWLLDDYQQLVKAKAASEINSGNQNSSPDAYGLEVLSHRERQVLEQVAEGLNNQEIGKLLSLSPKTIARHRERIMNKLNLHSRTELVKFAIKTGLVRLD